jgi:hypothetical protein
MTLTMTRDLYNSIRIEKQTALERSIRKADWTRCMPRNLGDFSNLVRRSHRNLRRRVKNVGSHLPYSAFDSRVKGQRAKGQRPAQAMS